MVSVFSPVKEMKPDEYRRVTEVTYLGTVYGTLSVINPMLQTVATVSRMRGFPGVLSWAWCAAFHVGMAGVLVWASP